MPASNVTLTAVYKVADSVGDGITDAWRSTYFGGNGSTTTPQSIAAADPDADGFSNMDEFEAGTDPNDAASYYKITNYQLDSGDITIDFPTVANRRYRLESSKTLASESWSPLLYEIIGDGQPKQLMLSSNVAQEFFRIRSTYPISEAPDGL